MKPPIEYRPPTKAPNARPGKAPNISSPPPAEPGGRWVWVPEGKKVTFRDAGKSKEYMRGYMRQRRAKQP